MTTYYKGFDKDFRCRGHQFEVGRTYTVTGDVRVCRNGFHVCEKPVDVLNYYPLVGSRFATVEINGDTDKTDDDSKLAARSITVTGEIGLRDFIRVVVDSIVSDRAPAATTGFHAPAATTGDYAPAATTGRNAPAATTGRNAPAATTGFHAPAATTGRNAPAATTGRNAPAATTGFHAPAATTGRNAPAMAAGWNGRASAAAGSGIALCEYDDDGNLVAMRAAMVGTEGIEPGVFYTLKGGQFVEADSQE